MVFMLMGMMHISYTELMALPVEDVNTYYAMCVDKQVYNSMEQMGLHSIDYREKEKCGTDFYKNFLDEKENDVSINDVLPGLSESCDEIKPMKIKTPEFLINKKKAK
jgi:hypothetical protein